MDKFGNVAKYMDSVKDFKETLTDPNEKISEADFRLGKKVEFKVH